MNCHSLIYERVVLVFVLFIQERVIEDKLYLFLPCFYPYFLYFDINIYCTNSRCFFYVSNSRDIFFRVSWLFFREC